MPTRLRVNGFKDVKKGEALAHLPFKHSRAWCDSLVTGRRTSPYISTELHEGESCLVKLHQDSSTGGGRTRLFQAEKLPRTVLSTVNAQESPTAVLARREMLDWRLLQLEPSVLRAPDGFDAPSQLAASGAHLPATLFRLSQEPERHAGEPPARRGVSRAREGRRTRAHPDCKPFVRADRAGRPSENRPRDTELPPKALCDGTLRFLALASAEIDPILTGLICMEEPENGIHPERIGAMIRLLRDIAVDPELTVDDDNPLRQVITHSPVVVSQVPDDSLVFAVPEQRVVESNLIKGVSFRSLSEAWREKAAGMEAIAKGKALAFLQPIAEKGDPKLVVLNV